ncbi:uncharacterized protein BCR38DRAFT_505967 [Pseudomassariella vexata]|uniref:Uncharacterized protein n=1 Tax=Pseudomassariella vexata TaxID=1141098 RepID=A0A1Y2D8U9_9PEZI|nr:uncharacterized protein BCR38DRAFT_505967 [Pseudomassariella vexata]ORY55693.1 hypothetical protein BCR38DRAFT_505967 [Pseudomassariella vexata]
MPPNNRRKLPEEYSTNPNTIRARKRKAGLSPYAREVEQAKASDSKAVTRAWKARIETETRQQGLDADTKISRFIQRMSMAPVSPKPENVDPALGSMAPPPTPVSAMQPIAQMMPPTSSYGAHQSTVSTPSRHATPGPILPYPVPSIERANEFANHLPVTPSPLFHHEADGATNDASLVTRLQGEVASYASQNAALQRDLESTKRRVTQLEGMIEMLNNDLVTSKGCIAAQESRLEDVNIRMSDYDGTAAVLRNAESDFENQAEKLRRIVAGVKMIADVTCRVATELGQGARGNNPVTESTGHANGFNGHTNGSREYKPEVNGFSNGNNDEVNGVKSDHDDLFSG